MFTVNRLQLECGAKHWLQVPHVRMSRCQEILQDACADISSQQRVSISVWAGRPFCHITLQRPLAATAREWHIHEGTQALPLAVTTTGIYHWQPQDESCTYMRLLRHVPLQQPLAATGRELHMHDGTQARARCSLQHSPWPVEGQRRAHCMTFTLSRFKPSGFYP
jgi:hypothetical protein